MTQPDKRSQRQRQAKKQVDSLIEETQRHDRNEKRFWKYIKITVVVGLILTGLVAWVTYPDQPVVWTKLK